MTDIDNASLLTNAAALLERARSDERALELEMTVLQTRLEARARSWRPSPAARGCAASARHVSWRRPQRPLSRCHSPRWS